MRKAGVTACAIVAIVAGLATTSSAQSRPSDRRTYFTFSGPVELPGQVLPAGKYVFRIPGADTAKRVVEVASGDGMKSFGVFHTMPSARVNPVEKPEIRFIETAAGQPPAVRTWWFAGEIDGREFVHPKARAVILAKTATEPVLTTRSDTTTTVNDADSGALARVNAAGEEVSVDQNARTTPYAPSGAVQSGEPVDTIARNEAADQPAGTAGRMLPKTASVTPLLGLFSALALGGGFGLGAWRRRSTRG